MRSLVVAAAALALLAALPAEASADRCRDVIDTGPTGFDPADSVRIETRNVDCRTARSLAAKAGLIAVRQRARLRGFDCRDLGRRRDGFFSQRCRRGGRLVSWLLGPGDRRCRGTVFIPDPGVRVRFWVQGVSCRRGRFVLEHSDPFPAGWRNAGRSPDGRIHVVRNRPRARIAYR
jgi:hypothetical protein